MPGHIHSQLILLCEMVKSGALRSIFEGERDKSSHTLVLVNGHGTISEVVGRSGRKRAVDRDLVVVSS